jgi:hypothetical protein
MFHRKIFSIHTAKNDDKYPFDRIIFSLQYLFIVILGVKIALLARALVCYRFLKPVPPI